MIPPALLPLSSSPVVKWHGVQPRDFSIDFVAALARCGVDASKAFLSTEAELFHSILDQADAALVRPSYVVLTSSTPDALRDYERRLTHAQTSNPQNGYNYLSLSFLWLYKGDASRALDAARKAVDLLGNIADAHFAEALALCGEQKPKLRSKEDAEGNLCGVLP